MSEKYTESERVPRRAKEKFNHFMEDIHNDTIDLFTVNCALYHMGYLLVSKKDLHNHTQQVQDEVERAHDATRRDLCKLPKY